MLLFSLYVADSEILRGTHSATQYREESLQIMNVGMRQEQQLATSLPTQKIQASFLHSVLAQPGAEKDTTSEGSHIEKDSRQKKAQQNTVAMAKSHGGSDLGVNDKSSAKAMLEKATKAYGLLCKTHRSRHGKNQKVKTDKKLKADRREAWELIERWRGILRGSETPANDAAQPHSSRHDTERNGIRKNDESHDLPQSYSDDSGFTSQAPTGSTTWMAERPAFLLNKQYPDAKDAPMQLSPVAVKEPTDQYNDITFIKEVSKTKPGGRTLKQVESMSSTISVGGTSKADAIMID